MVFLAYRSIEEWCRGRDPRDKSILAGDIRVIGYDSDSRILDLAGLVWPDALEYATPDSVVAAYRPDYLMFKRRAR